MIERALAVLRADGYLDDARFARLFAEDKRVLEQWGSERIRRTLLGRGIERELVEDALAGQAAGAELDQAVDVLTRRFPGGPADARDRERALGVLLRKGYDSELALDALARHARRP